MKISAIIPTHNRKQFLSESIESALSQSLPPDEILIINNGKEKLDLPADIINKVTIFDIIPDAGVSQARNFGALMASGDYLAFLDDDDLWGKDYLENAERAINQGSTFIISRLDKMKDGEVTKYKNIHNKLDIGNLFVLNPGINGSNIVISKKLFYKLGGFDAKLPTSEDKSLLIEALRINEGVKVLPDNQAILRVHNQGSLSGAKSIAAGIYQFARKYKSVMNKTQYFYNMLKYSKNEYDSGNKKIIAKYFYYKTIFGVFNLFTRQI